MTTARFLTRLNDTPIPTHRRWYNGLTHRRKWRLIDHLVYKTDVADGRIIVVPGYPLGHHLFQHSTVIDFSSVPRIPIIWTLFGDSAHKAAAPHDFGYERAGDVGAWRFAEPDEPVGLVLPYGFNLIPVSDARPLTRAEVDAIFFEAMQAPGPEDLPDADCWPLDRPWSLDDIPPDWQPEEGAFRQWGMWAGVRAFGGVAGWGK